MASPATARNLLDMFSSVTRVGLAGLAAAALLGLSACSSGGGAASVTTLTLRSPSYQLKPAVTTTTLPTVPVADAEGRSQAEQEYTVHEDEYPSEIAALFDVNLDELRRFNGWEEDWTGYPAPGGTVRIPPGAKFIDPAATTTTEPDTGEGEQPADDTAGSEAPDPESCTPGTHELQEGDYPVTVARKYDITLEALLAANNWALDPSGNVPQWPGPGGEVNIPAGSDCATTTTTIAAG